MFGDTFDNVNMYGQTSRLMFTVRKSRLMFTFRKSLLMFTVRKSRLMFTVRKYRFIFGPWPEMTDIINILIRCEFAYHVEFAITKLYNAIL